MKKFYSLLFALLLGNLVIQAQDTQKLESFRNSALKEYRMYFSRAELTENGQLSLAASDQYIPLNADAKLKILENITSAWQQSLVLIRFDAKNELWGRNKDTGKTELLDVWDLKAAQAILTQPQETGKFARHPWFFYLGEQGMYDTNKNINLSLNTRLGFFLLENRWDLAATYSFNFMGNADSDATTGQSNLGLMSKVYFPIKKYNISPNVGGEISMATVIDEQNVTTNSMNKSFLIGISWFVGIGSLDIGIRTGDEVMTMIGFTIFPKAKSKSRNNGLSLLNAGK